MELSYTSLSRLQKTTKTVNGKVYRFCTGPYCRQRSEGGKWFELNRENFYLRWYKENRVFRSQCKRCHSYHVHMRSDVEIHGMIPAEKVLPILNELIDRIGKAETGRRAGISQQTIWGILNVKDKTVRRVTAKKLIKVLAAVREKGESRTKEEIHHNSELRKSRAGR